MAVLLTKGSDFLTITSYRIHTVTFLTITFLNLYIDKFPEFGGETTLHFRNPAFPNSRSVAV